MAATTHPEGRWYSDRTAIKSFIFADTSVTDKDNRIDKLIARASAWIENYTGRHFFPWTGTKEFDFQRSTKLILGDDLVSVTTLAHGDGTDTIDSGDYFLYPLNAADDNKPYTSIEILVSDDFLTYDDSKQSAIQITGKWGYCEIKRLTASILTAAITSTTATTAAVTAGTDFAIGQTILIDDEQMFISNVSSNNLTVVRGMNGTTAAAHLISSVTYILEAPLSVMMACEMLVAQWLHAADSMWSNPSSERTIKRDVKLTEVKGLLKGFRRMVYNG